MKKALPLFFVLTSLFLNPGVQVQAEDVDPASLRSLLSSSLHSKKITPVETMTEVSVDTFKDILSSTIGGNLTMPIVAPAVLTPEDKMPSDIPKSPLKAVLEEIKQPVIRETVEDIADRISTGKSVDFKQAVTDILNAKVHDQIDDSKLTVNEKKLAHAAISRLNGEDGALFNETASQIEAKLVKEGIPKESATSIARKISTFMADTDNFAALKDASSELAQDLVTKYVGSKGAATINAAIEEYMSAEGTLKSTAKKTLDTAIDQYVRDPASNAALKKAMTDIENGKTPDCQAIGTALAKHGADKLIDDSKLSANEKVLAHAVVAEMAGEDGALLNATADHIQKKLIKAGVAEETAKSISGNIQTYLADTGNTAALKAAGSESLQALVTKCVDPKGAATINAAIQTYMSAKGTAKDAAVVALDTAIDQYVRDSASNAALKKALGNLNAGEAVNYMEVGTALARHGADKLIDNFDLSANQKKLAHAVIADIAGEDGAFLNATEDYIKAKLIKAGGFPEGTASQVAGFVHDFLNDTNNVAALKNAASASMQELVNQYVGGKGAEVINSGIREFMSADGTLKSTAETALNTAIDQYVRDPASNAALKKAVADLKDGKTVDYKGTATALARYGADDLIEKSNLSANQKKLAHAVIADIAGEDGALLNATGTYLKDKMIKKGIPADKASSISGNIQTFLADTGNTAALRSAASEAAQTIVSRYVGEKGAAVINSAIENYMSDKGTVGSAAGAALDAAIDQYVKGDDAKKALKDAIEKSMNGQSVDYTKVGKTVFDSYAKDIIDNSKLSPEEKKLVHNVLDSMNGELPWSETGAEALEAVMVKAGLSQEQAEDLSRKIVNFATGDGSLGSIVDSAKSIFSSKIAEAIDKQLEKWEQKFPFISSLYEIFGIDREDIVKFFQNLSFSDVKAAFTKICNMSLEDWKNIGKQLLDRMVDKVVKKLTSVLTKLANKFIQWLKKSVKKVLSKIHFLEDYMSYIELGLDVVGNIGVGKVNELIQTGVSRGGEELKGIWGGGNGSGGGSGGLVNGN